jgi:membrane protein YqaA with SNARE-associated domain
VTAALLLALGGAVVSALVPLLNAELLLVGLRLTTPAAAPLLVVVVAVGQMIGKCALFLTAGRAARGALAPKLARWGLDGRTRCVGAPMLVASAAVGLPPFYLMAVAAPVLGIRLRTFALVGLVGRIIRFAAVLAVPAAVASFVH